MKNSIQTVTGSIAKNEIGRCLAHQHVIFGYPGWENAVQAPYKEEEQLSKACSVLNDAKERYGLKTIVDATPADCGRMPLFLKKVSELTGINIVMTSGYYYEGEGAPAYFKFRMAYGNAEEEIYKMMYKEVTEGVGDTGIKAGVLKVASGAGAISEYEDLFMRAAARVSAETDTPIITHTQKGTMGAEQAKRLKEYGADPNHIMIGHLDNCTDADELLKVAEEGVFMGFDRMGLQGFTGAPLESRKLVLIDGIASLGYADKICLAHDSIVTMLGDPWIYSEQDAEYLKDWDWVHVFKNIMPQLIKMGLPESTVERFVTDNPANMLVF